MAGPVVRRMEPRDLPAVMEIDAASLKTPWSEGVWRKELRSPFGTYLVLEEGGRLRGQIGVRCVADELHVMTLAVHPGHRRRGYARALVRAVVEQHPDARHLYLEVRRGNKTARALYESLGLRLTGFRHRYYGDEDALLMTLDLC